MSLSMCPIFLCALCDYVTMWLVFSLGFTGLRRSFARIKDKAKAEVKVDRTRSPVPKVIK